LAEPLALSRATAGDAAGLWRRLRDRLARRGSPEGIRITKVGLWFVLFTVIVAVAATNTGNNALYMVLATMLALLVVSGLSSRWNLGKLAVSFEAPVDVYAKRPFSLTFAVRNGSRRLPRWLLLLSIARHGIARLVPYLPARTTARGTLELMLPRRGRHRLEAAHFSSLFPLGLFRKGMRYPVQVEILVYPELFPAGASDVDPSGLTGEHSGNRAGWGHELHSLRAFRQGDDPRNIHWKQTARTGALVYQERDTELSLRLAIVFDNATGALASEAARNRFEHLVSEAATVAVDHLDLGYEVELVTRDVLLPFSGGTRQRRAILEALALLEPVARRRSPLGSTDPRSRELRLALAPSGGERGEAIA
jgi:uncharacterized protein (DUF58 family)